MDIGSQLLAERAAHAAEISRLKRDHMIEIMAVVSAVGGKVSVTPRDMYDLPSMELVKLPDRRTGGHWFILRKL